MAKRRHFPGPVLHDGIGEQARRRPTAGGADPVETGVDPLFFQSGREIEDPVEVVRQFGFVGKRGGVKCTMFTPTLANRAAR